MNPTTNKLAIPIAILIAGALVAGAIVYTQKSAPQVQAEKKIVNIRAVSNKDHIRGNPDAPIIIVEYSDTECPFCKKFQSTMQQVMTDFGKDGKVAWVYRHFPISQLHSKALKEAEATECVADLGGEDKFWQYIDKIYEITPTNDGLDPALLSSTAVALGIDKTKFDTCLSSGKFAKKVQADIDDGAAAGVNGTPHSVVVTKKGTQVPISGAQPYAVVSQIITTLLTENK